MLNDQPRKRLLQRVSTLGIKVDQMISQLTFKPDPIVLYVLMELAAFTFIFHILYNLPFQQQHLISVFSSLFSIHPCFPAKLCYVQFLKRCHTLLPLSLCLSHWMPFLTTVTTTCQHLLHSKSRASSVLCCCSVAKSYLTLQPHALQHSRLPCPSFSPTICSN